MTILVGLEDEYEYEDILDDGNVALFVFDKTDLEGVTTDIAEIFSECYISKENLEQLANMNGLDVGEQLEEMLPDKNTMKSGDFGEIFTKQFLHEYEGGKFPVYRWRNRSNRNDTVRGTDLIGYVNVGGKSSPKDCLILCEVKTRARTVKGEVVLDAYEGVKKDFASRMANSLVFCQHRALQDGDNLSAQELARYRNPHKKPYKQKLLASVVHKESTWDDSFLDHLPDKHGLSAELKVLIFHIDDLAEFIDEVYATAVEEAE